MSQTLTVKQLHAATGASVRSARNRPIHVTDRGQLVAVIAHPSMLRPINRKRVLLPEFTELMKLPPTDTIQAALDDDRGDR